MVKTSTFTDYISTSFENRYYSRVFSSAQWFSYSRESATSYYSDYDDNDSSLDWDQEIF